VRYVTVTGDVVIIDTNIAIAMDRAARGLPLNEAQKLMLQAAEKQGVVTVSKTVGELAEKGGIKDTLSVTREVAVPAAERDAILKELESKGVGGPKGVKDREIVTQSLLAETAPAVTPILATADNGIINSLARMAGIDPARLGRYRNVAEYLRYEQGTNAFTVTIRGRQLQVRPVQPIREGLK
jgi:hypothetical protein